MAFKIRIEEIIEQTIEEREYQRVADSGNQHDAGAKYGYVTKGPKQITVETKIYEQMVAQIDLARVILAVNAVAMEKLHFKEGIS